MGDLKLTSSAFSDGGEIPPHHSLELGNNSPPLTISGIPMEAKSLVLIMDDPDAAKVPKEQGGQGKVWIHWVMWNIGTYHHWYGGKSLTQRNPELAKYFPDPTTINIPEGVGNIDTMTLHNPEEDDLSDAMQFALCGISQGTNSFCKVGYGGPAPPKPRRHTYVFKLYALDIFTDSQGTFLLDVEHRDTAHDVEKAIEDHILDGYTIDKPNAILKGTFKEPIKSWQGT